MQVNNMLSYIISIGLTMSLNIVFLPESLKFFNPDWVLLALIYWTLVFPEKLGVFNAWFVGILLDVLTGRMLGQHALAYALVSFACLKLHKRLHLYPVVQQSLFIFFCLLISQMMMFWIEKIDFDVDFKLIFILPLITGTLCWPLVYSVLRYLRFFGRIN